MKLVNIVIDKEWEDKADKIKSYYYYGCLLSLDPSKRPTSNNGDGYLERIMIRYILLWTYSNYESVMTLVYIVS